MPFLWLFSGLILLYFGAEGLVRASSNIALKLGLSPLIVGLTIVAFGTSFPELVVSINAGISNMGDVAIGNVIGSNIFNIAVILGIAACIRPLKVDLQLLRRDVPLMVGITLLLVLFLSDRMISRLNAGILLVVFVAYILKTVVRSQNTAAEVKSENDRYLRNPAISVIILLSGLIGLVVGARLFTKGGVAIAEQFSIPQAIIGLTIIATGTSLPELATTIVATIRKETDLAIGNVVGSNIFNILAILGISGLIKPVSTAGIQLLDQIILVVTAVLLLPFMRSGFRLNRLEGLFFVCRKRSTKG